ncbi:MAG: family 1 encapsulin nanocompartment shell protein [Christensenellales bacterium]|jgi:uncharacterized linocin/CFP29 family protein
MDYLARDDAPFSQELWEKIDTAIVDTVRNNLTGRRFLRIFGPLGGGIQSINIDSASKAEEDGGGIIKTTGRKYVEIPQLYEDFTLLWRDIAFSEKSGQSLDLSSATLAAQAMAQREDRLVFFGNQEYGYDGLMTAAGINTIKKGDWNVGETPFSDIAEGVALLAGKGHINRYSLTLSLDLYAQLQRIQAGTGVLEIDRIKSMLDGRVFKSPVLGVNKAVLVSAEPHNMDLAIGQDIEAAYLELKDLNHVLRIMETVVLRLKRPDAVVVYE